MRHGFRTRRTPSREATRALWSRWWDAQHETRNVIQLPNRILLVSESLYKTIKSTATQSPAIGVLADFSGFEIRPTPMLPMRFRVTREMRRSKRYYERKAGA